MANRLAEANSGGEIGAPLRRRLTVTETVDKDHATLLGSSVAVATWVHLNLFDRLFLRYGRIDSTVRARS